MDKNADKDAKRKLPVLRLHFTWSLILTVPMAAVILALVLSIQPGSFTDVIIRFRAQPALIWYNFLPIWLLLLSATFFLHNVFTSSAVIGAFCCILSLVNRIMIESRDEPLSPKDFALIKEAANAAGNYDLNISLSSVLIIAGLVLITAAAAVFIRFKPLFKNNWLKAAYRVIPGSLTALILVLCINLVYSSAELYNSFRVGNAYYIAGVYQQLGFPYCFCYNFNTYLVDEPEGFSTGETQKMITETTTSSGDPKDINVIMIMNEAFTDINDNEIFDYSPADDPLKNLKAIREDENCIFGEIVVPNFGAGTANTEFDVITGMQTGLLSATGVSAFRVLNHDIGSIFSVFRDEGYYTEFIHPGEAWFYNRQNVYKYFGAEELLFVEEFEDAERMGQWVTDSAVQEVLISQFEDAMAAGERYFNYTVTIQNHMSYSEEKYGDFKVPGIKTNVPLSEEAESMLSVYTYGVRDADIMLGELREYFSRREEPVMLAYFGDHKPQLGADYLCYKELGMDIGESEDPDTTLTTYTTPYVIWVNDPAARELNFSQAKKNAELPENGMISANYLGALVLELTGREDTDPFFAYVNDLRRELPVYHNNAGYTADGEVFSQLPEEYSYSLRKLHFWQYYRLKHSW